MAIEQDQVEKDREREEEWVIAPALTPPATQKEHHAGAADSEEGPDLDVDQVEASALVEGSQGELILPVMRGRPITVRQLSQKKKLNSRKSNTWKTK